MLFSSLKSISISVFQMAMVSHVLSHFSFKANVCINISIVKETTTFSLAKQKVILASLRNCLACGKTEMDTTVGIYLYQSPIS